VSNEESQANVMLLRYLCISAISYASLAVPCANTESVKPAAALAVKFQ
jgi:hypothetical protein